MNNKIEENMFTLLHVEYTVLLTTILLLLYFGGFLSSHPGT